MKIIKITKEEYVRFQYTLKELVEVKTQKKISDLELRNIQIEVI